MIKLAADEDFNNDILRGMWRELPDLDIVRVQDTDWSGAEDPDILEWAARENRLILSHDKSTMTNKDKLFFCRFDQRREGCNRTIV